MSEAWNICQFLQRTINTIDYSCEDRKKVGELRGDIWCHLIGLDSLFQKTSIITPQKTNRSARRCVWRYCFKAGVWNCQILNQVVESQLFTSLWNRYHQWLFDIELIQVSAFSASYSSINSCFTAGKRIGVWKCHATFGRWKTTIFPSIVYAKPNAFFPLQTLFCCVFVLYEKTKERCRAGCRQSVSQPSFERIRVTPDCWASSSHPPSSLLPPEIIHLLTSAWRSE